MAFTNVRRAAEVPVPPAYAAAVKSKAKRDAEAFRSFRAIDQAEHDRAHRQRMTATVAAVENDLRLWREDIEGVEPEATAALAGFRAAEDRARSARELARQQLAAYELVKGKESPEAELEALIRSDTAEQVASDAAKVMEEKRAEMVSADQSLTETREGLAEAERGLDRARKAAALPAGEAPISDATIAACAAWMQVDVVWDTLSREDKSRVQRLAQPRDLMSDREWRAMMREVLAIGGGVA